MESLVNGAPRPLLDGPPDRPLLTVLRDELHLTGTKYGCGEGQCGACTVLIGGQPIRSCQTPVSSVDGASLTTIEGLAQGETLHPVQQGFLDEGAFQCGYCTPGMILTAAALLDRIPKPSESQIREALNGNVCRCGGYPRIIAAVQRAAEILATRTASR